MKLQTLSILPTNRLSVFDHFVKLALQVCNFTKKETLALVFACEFCAISKNTYFTEYLRTTASSLVPCVRYFPVNSAKLLRTLFWQNTSRRLLLTYALVLAKNTSIYLTRSRILGQLALFICGLKGIKMSVMPIRSNRLSDAFFWEDIPTEMFFYEFCEFLRRAFFIEHLRWLFLMLSNLYDHTKTNTKKHLNQILMWIYNRLHFEMLGHTFSHSSYWDHLRWNSDCIYSSVPNMRLSAHFLSKIPTDIKVWNLLRKIVFETFFWTKIGKKTPRVLWDPPTLSNLLKFAESLLPLLIKTKEQDNCLLAKCKKVYC